MAFLQRIADLNQLYKDTSGMTENGVALLGVVPSPPPLAKHYVFPPMPVQTMDLLRDSYTREFPRELLSIYAVANGMDLFWKEVKLPSGRVFPFCCLSVYGYPIGPLRTQLQPHNIQLEDGTRILGTPDSYLKFGLFRKIEDLECKGEYELFIDTETHLVCSADRSAKEFHPIDHWDSLDTCLCSLFDQLLQTS